MQKDSSKSNLYANGAFTIGGTNEDLRDDVYDFQGNIYREHHFSIFKAWYGAGITLGITTYTVMTAPIPCILILILLS